MKVTVTDYLNVRVGKPSVNAPSYQYLAPGSEIEVDEELYQGDKFEGQTTWLRDRAGNFYWSGATQRPSASTFPWWLGDFGVDQVWSKSTGKNVTVILLDSGVNANVPGLTGKVGNSQTVIGGNGNDKIGHGTLMASIIAGRAPGIQGVAPDVGLISIKITDDKNILPLNLIAGLQSVQTIIAENPGSQYVVNCSFALFGLSAQDQQNISTEINKIASHSKVVICAAAGNNSLWNHSFPILPARIPGVISADGLFKQADKYDRLSSSNFWPDINLTAPAEYPTQQLQSFFLSQLEPQGSSHACAYLSGLMALFASKTVASGKAFAGTDAKTLLAKVTSRGTEFPPATRIVRDKLVAEGLT